MFLHLTSACLVLLLAVNAQLYNNMGAAYTDQASLYGDDDAADVGTYDNGYDAYEDEDLAHIIFSTEKLKELYTCLCMGTSEECNIYYQQEGDGWSVSVVQKNGTFEVDNDLCKYYLCSHEEVNQVISCSQAARTAACESGVVAQFFRRQSHVCCGLTCIGLFWYSVEEQISFIENASDVESCDTSCLCSGDGGEDAPKVVKVTSNDTHIDKYIIHQPVRNISATTASTKTSSLMTTLSSSKTNKWTSATTKSNSSELNPLIKSPSSDSKKDNNRTFIIIVATSAAGVVVAVIIIFVVFIVKRNKQQRKLTLKTNDKSLEAGSAPEVEPHLSSFGPATTGKPAALYSRIPPGGPDQSATDTNKPSSKAPGFRNGVNQPEGTNREPQNQSAVNNEYTYSDFSGSNRAGKNRTDAKPNSGGSNRIVKNRTDARPSESAGLINDGSDNDNGKFKVSSSIRDASGSEKDVSLRQPLLLRPEIKESVV